MQIPFDSMAKLQFLAQFPVDNRPAPSRVKSYNLILLVYYFKKILRDFEIQTDHLIPGGNQQEEKRLSFSESWSSNEPRLKLIERKKRNKYLNFSRELKKYRT